MVFQPQPSPPPQQLLDVRVCNLSLYRHETSILLLKQGGRGGMGESVERHQQLPQVELRPFTKQVWRREKSLPDFYEKKQHPESKSVAKEIKIELSPLHKHLVSEIDTAKEVPEPRHGVMPDFTQGKPRCHPKAEFLHESSKGWRSNDLIPSFITRLERTKTTLESFQKSGMTDYRGLYESQNGKNYQTSQGTMTINGGRMNQRVYKRQLLYLNPLDSYRHLSTLPSSRRDLEPLTRNSFPLTSTRAKELRLNGSGIYNYPLRPIKHEHAPSPHKFNNKLGAAKSSLQILSKWGIPTKLEKNLQKEFEMNLERFRRERIVLPADLFNVSQPTSMENNLTRGEILLRQAREANRAKKKRDLQVDALPANDHCDGGDSGIQSPEDIVNGETPRVVNTCVDLLRHPINYALREESEGNDAISVKRLSIETDGGRQPVGELPAKPHAVSIERSNLSQSGDDKNISSKEKIVIDVSDVESSEMNHPTTKSNVLDILQREDAVMTHDHKGRSQSAGAAKLTPTFHFEKSTPSSFPPDPDDRSSIVSHESKAELSQSARAKTNLDYLHSLRIKGGLPPLQPIDIQALSQDPNIELHYVPSEQYVGIEGLSSQRTWPVDQSHFLKSADEIHDIQHYNETKTCSTVVSVPKEAAESQLDSTDSKAEDGEINYPTSGESGRERITDITVQPVDNAIENQQTSAGSSNHNEESIQSTNVNTQNCDISPSPAQNTGMEQSETANTIDNSQTLEGQTTDNVNEYLNTNQGAKEYIPSEHKDLTKQPELGDKENTSDANSMDITNDEGISMVNDSDKQQEISPVQETNKNSADQVSEIERDLDAENITSLNSPSVSADVTELSTALGDQSCLPLPSVARGDDEVVSVTASMTTSNLDTSLGPMSDAECIFSASADNGDSGISTTFLTATDSQPQELEGIML